MFFFFFFQAEDGIRDAQESRGLGDVYKRQILRCNGEEVYKCRYGRGEGQRHLECSPQRAPEKAYYTLLPHNPGTYRQGLLKDGLLPVSYTHLTLPTKRIV
eukprot:TRINITY_DN2863_c0_g1_i6.p1 TRINITY_DN2863_c0_g1~~TRINITY_DN2863_c0_g1_i6.p1  ORF type:complete len:101 (+),score=24.30 TRINITY_DN2863_c0_g1_i6:110-412(+)